MYVNALQLIRNVIYAFSANFLIGTILFFFHIGFFTIAAMLRPDFQVEGKN
jgi:hypothetical protein